jgi:hypothetical protein
MNEYSQSNRFRTIVIAVMVLMVILLLWFIINSLTKVGKNKLELVIVPAYATVTVNGEKVGSKELYLDDGEYNIQITSPGFTSFNNTFSVPDTKGPIVALLRAESPEAQEWAAKNQAAYQQAEGIASEAITDSSEQRLEEYPIVGDLPVAASFYRVDYSLADESNLVLQITADTEIGRQAAIENIRTLGYEPTDYRIEFKQFLNPFVNDIEIREEALGE